jgi:hypothetical protein
MSRRDDTARLERLSAYLDGELTADELREVETMLNQDPEARRTLAALEDVANLTESEEAPQVPPDLAKRIKAAVGRERRGARRGRGGRRLARWATVAGGVAAALAVAALLHEDWERLMPPQGRTVSTEPAEEPAGSPLAEDAPAVQPPPAAGRAAGQERLEEAPAPEMGAAAPDALRDESGAPRPPTDAQAGEAARAPSVAPSATDRAAGDVAGRARGEERRMTPGFEGARDSAAEQGGRRADAGAREIVWLGTEGLPTETLARGAAARGCRVVLVLAGGASGNGTPAGPARELLEDLRVETLEEGAGPSWTLLWALGDEHRGELHEDLRPGRPAAEALLGTPPPDCVALRGAPEAGALR